MDYCIEVRVKLKPGVLDAEGKNIRKSLDLLGIPVADVASVKTYQLKIESSSPEGALATAEDACRRLLANPVVHDYTVRLFEPMTNDG